MTDERLRKFGYDVSVSVLANLVAAAILYLVASTAGLIPRNSGLSTLAIMISVAFVIWGRQFLWNPSAPHVRQKMAIIPALYLITAIGMVIRYMVADQMSKWAGIPLVVFCFFILILLALTHSPSTFALREKRRTEMDEG